MNDALKRPTATLIAILAILGRFLPHPPNFTPVGSAALFGGAKIGRPFNYLLPLLVMFVTDLLLGFHSTMLYVYLSFVAIVWLGERLLSQKASVNRVAGVSLLSSTLFFLVTNFGVWLQGGLYPHTLAGLANCYSMAIPFFGATLAGDLLFSVGFFGLYALAEQQQLIQTFDKKLLAWLR